MPVEVDHLAVVPAPVALLDVGQVEACCTEPLLVARVNLFKNIIIFFTCFMFFLHVFYFLFPHLGDPAVVGGWVQKVCRAVGGVVVIPWKIHIILKAR